MEVNSPGERPARWQGAFGSAALWFAAVTPYAVARLDEPGLLEHTRA